MLTQRTEALETLRLSISIRRISRQSPSPFIADLLIKFSFIAQTALFGRRFDLECSKLSMLSERG